MSKTDYRKEVETLAAQGMALWRQDAQRDAIPAEPSVVYDWLFDHDFVRESAYCNALEKVVATIHYGNVHTADRMFPLTVQESLYYNTTAILLSDIAFRVLLASVTGVLFTLLGGYIGEEKSDAPND